MKITTARRSAQIFFFGLFIWLCVVAAVGTEWWQWRGWPVAWFLQLDPLVALGTMLTTHSLHPPLAWALLTVVFTILLGRVFCGFVCPFGALHQFVGWVARRGRLAKDRIAANTYHPSQAIKYYILLVLLGAAAGNLVFDFVRATRGALTVGRIVALGAVVTLLWLTLRKFVPSRRRALAFVATLLLGWTVLAAILPQRDAATVATLQIGLLDPIPLLWRSINLAVLPAADLGAAKLFPSGRFYTGVELVGALFLAFLLLNLVWPRFFCRVLCPLGALLGVLGKGTLWSIRKTTARCTKCSLCDVACEGACNPTGPIRTSECLMCMNCLDTCPPAEPLDYGARPSAGGEIAQLGVTRRGFVATLAAGAAVAPLTRLAGATKSDWPAGMIRPPGAVAEEEFLARCIKCTACMRVCPTNVLQPATFAHGWESVWTPLLNNRIGTSGCQLNCIACGHACPTGAIRPLTLAEKHGEEDFAGHGPIRIGLAAVDRGRCLPWAMQKPCIVCEENCPVTPKAIYVSETTDTIRDGVLPLLAVEGATIRVGGPPLAPQRFASGDFFARISGSSVTQRIVASTADALTLETPVESVTGVDAPGANQHIEVQVRLQRPVVDPERCIGCGICEHECPISGLRAIRVTADNETRSRNRSVLLSAPSSSFNPAAQP